MRHLRRFAGTVLPLLFLFVPILSAGCDSPPQIVDISPGRGAHDVRTNLPLRIRFDRAVDKQSVTDRFSIRPQVEGEFSWDGPDTLVYRHRTLDTSTTYNIALELGYRDGGGRANGFRHSWVFHTERAPELRATTPNRGEQGVDPATYLALTFSREMLPDTLRHAIRFTPSVSYSVRGDPDDAHRVLVAPKSLLDPNSEYLLSVGGAATDVDGNQVRPARWLFHTGPLRPLARWITFLASEDPATHGGAGVWMVDEAGFPRVLHEQAAEGFSWSPDSTDLMIRNPGGTWTDHAFGADPATLPFTAQWAATLGRDAGYAFLDGDRLQRLLPDGTIVGIAEHVDEAVVSHDLNRIAFSVAAGGGVKGSELRAYDVALRTQYRLQHEAQVIRGITWAPSGAKLAYVLASPSGEAETAQLRVKALTGKAAVATVATGQIAEPTWLAGSHDLAFSALVEHGGGKQWRIFRINPSLQTAPLLVGNSLAPSLDADLLRPVPSPDGHQIAFLVSDGGRSQVWLMNADGTGAAKLTQYESGSFPFTCTDIHWSAS